MPDRKNLFIFFCALLLLFAAAAVMPARQALGQMTIPTRTPVPDGGGGPDPEPEPTDDNGGGGGGGGGDKDPQPTDEPQPEPTDEPQPTSVRPTAVPTNTPRAILSPTPVSATATATPLASALTPTSTPSATVTAEYILPTQEVVTFPESGQNFPEAGQCGMPPTYTTSQAISVYAGPSEAYPSVGLLGAREVRPIVGRAAFTNWWVVQLDRSGRAGWVSDETGTIHGFIGRVPIVSAPDLNGVSPKPAGPAWSPTPSPNCNAPELLAGIVAGTAADEGIAPNEGITADEVIAPDEGISPDEDIAGEVPPSGKPDSLAGLPQYDDASVITAGVPDSEDAVVIQSSGEGSADIVRSKRQAAADPLISELADSAAPLDLPASTSAQPLNLMPVAGLILILAAVFIGLAAKRNRTTIDE